LCKIIQTLNGPKPDLLHLNGGGLQRSLGRLYFTRSTKLPDRHTEGHDQHGKR
jgi:hypothetical protein